MAVSKAIRSNPPAQPHPQHAHTEPETPRPNQHQTKAEIFDVLRHLNRGYGIALAALDKLETKARQTQDRARIFPPGSVWLSQPRRGAPGRNQPRPAPHPCRT